MQLVIKYTPDVPPCVHDLLAAGVLLGACCCWRMSSFVWWQLVVDRCGGRGRESGYIHGYIDTYIRPHPKLFLFILDDAS